MKTEWGAALAALSFVLLLASLAGWRLVRLDRRLRRAQKAREEAATAQAERAMVKWRQENSAPPTNPPH